MAWHPTGRKFATCGGDRVIHIWRRGEGSADGWVLSDRLCDSHKRTIRSVAFSPSGHLLASAGFDGVVSIWSEGGGTAWRCVASLEGHENEVKSVSWSPNGKLLATCGRDKTVWIWELNPGMDEGADDDDLDFECLAVHSDHSQDVKCVAFHPFDSAVLASASYDDTVRLWRCSPGSDDEWLCSQTLAEHASTVWSLAYSPNGQLLGACASTCQPSLRC